VPEFSGQRPLPVKAAYDLFYRFAYRATITKAAKLICISQATADDVMRLYGVAPDRMRIVPYGIDTWFRPVTDHAVLAAFRDRHDLPKAFVLYVGNTRPHKNVPGLLEGFARFLAEPGAASATLVLAGSKERFFSDTRAMIHELGLERRVVCLDHLGDEELRWLYCAARVLVLLSTKEGFGLPPVEAMACGTPVLVSTYGALPEVVGEAGLQVDPFDYGEIGQALLRLWTDEELRETLRARGLGRAAQYTWEETARSTLEVYNEVLG
jgi:alpha-1,3-rhamnosyl/mannosyltransferase